MENHGLKKNGSFFDRKKVVFLWFPRVRTASPGFSRLPGIDFTIEKIDFYEKNPEYGNLE